MVQTYGGASILGFEGGVRMLWMMFCVSCPRELFHLGPTELILLLHLTFVEELHGLRRGEI